MTGFATSRFALSSATNSIGANIKSIVSGVACWDLQRPRQSWCRFRAWGRSWPPCSWAWALAWLVVQERRAQERIIPVALRRNRAIAGNFGSLTIGALLMCVVGFLPTYVHAVMGRSAAVAAFVVATLSVAWEYGSITAGRVVAKMSYRSNEAVGALTLIGGAALLITLDPNNCFAAMTTGALLIGIGMGICNLVFLLVVQGSVGWSEGASRPRRHSSPARSAKRLAREWPAPSSISVSRAAHPLTEGLGWRSAILQPATANNARRCSCAESGPAAVPAESPYVALGLAVSHLMAKPASPTCVSATGRALASVRSIASTTLSWLTTESNSRISRLGVDLKGKGRGVGRGPRRAFLISEA
jgi:hypothetical protein